MVTVHEVLANVNNALLGCPAPQSRFVQNPDSTITDSSTGLQWEAKTDDDSIHDVHRTFRWSAGSAFEPNGSVFTEFLVELNTVPCYADHCDWRLPTAAELQALVDHARFAPAADPVFNHLCVEGCSVCSCTALDYYWSTPGLADLPDSAWAVDFNYGFVNGYDKTLPFPARAVRP